MQKPQSLSPEEKIVELLKKREDTLEKLKELYKHFRGVKHEDSVSEIRYTHIKVLEGFVDSLNKELISLGYSFKGRG
ncbi:MAG: hypothetical protein A3H88_01650 [Candidatus Blackburnbacteria bacterium RIFCSPLOWO2_02_FULL_44_9]|uniref:Uncharacterized protein n=1 Tax=Candidatus Blackburnbacteria bacterium RIFCSPHIGHO2_02_FULL_44_20 TaxID=1797516 RepID=A0A1G1VA61_9BACT|nr:MAG: hypothetical protein A3D26_04095 [Candidatus Blackburnbacteria bacterium RIFCSPHIGHO2_02_FULL_44_20]OGY15924.1 MAG: hypothetical protein A3H88_01650 [Candidatus Blackburnbacteria bacterium RIFCSPLOWO2_02_FULL_44_9]